MMLPPELAVPALRVLLELPAEHVEGVTKTEDQVFVLLPVDDQVLSRYRQVDVDVIGTAGLRALAMTPDGHTAMEEGC
jgi:hypothetical protein